MGAVYRVEHLMMKKEMALKLLHPELGRLDEVARRFEREAEAAARLDHPHIITVTDFGRTADGLLFLVMELLNGSSLTEVIRPDGDEGVPLAPPRALAILRQILRALETAHGSGIVHRDLKPDNIMLVERDGNPDFVKLLDFGIAKMTSGSGPKETLTQAGVVFGTPEYLSPEQAMGEEADGRADLYAAGVILYEMLTGRRPYESDSKVEVVSMHLTRPIPPLRRSPTGVLVPVWLDAVVERAMAKKRDERYPSAAAFLEAIDERAARRPPSLKMARASVARRWLGLVERAERAGVPWPRTFLAVGAALLVGLAALLVILRRPSEPAPPRVSALEQAETLLGRGQLEAARAALQQVLAANPQLARGHYLLGNLDFAQNQREPALAAYRRAIQLDGRFKSDAVLRANVSALLDRRGEGPEALALLADDIGKPALPELVACAKLCKDERIRHRAAEAAAHLGGPKLVDEPAVDENQASVDKLRGGRSCRERRVAAQALIATGERRYLDSLRAARERRGGFLGLEEINACMRRELDAGIRKLEAAK
jgi:tRNA A-37 threonylcarbamoyl transferase component Bud32